MALTTVDAGLLNTQAQYTGFKNRIINGAMMIDQRNAGASVTPVSGQYTLDRWSSELSQNSKFTVQQNASSVTPPVGFTKYIGVTSSSAYSSGASDYFDICQRIEGQNISDLAWGTANAATVTLSFWVRSSLTGTFSGAVQNSGASRSYPFPYTISSANTWEYKTVTIPGDTSGTWLTTNGMGIQLCFDLGSGTSLKGTANTWAGTWYIGTTGSTSLVGTSGATLYITGVQLEKGSTATSFDYRPYGTELALCQRYYQKTYSQSVAPGNNTGIGGVGYQGSIMSYRSTTTNVVCFTWLYKTVMRTVPTVTFYAPGTGNSGNFSSSTSDMVASTNGAIIGDGTAIAFGTATVANDCYIQMTASAEL